MSWLTTQDHKRIAILYLISITLMFFFGGAFAAVIRLELLTPQPELVASDTYNKLFSMHGIIMIFLFLVPSVPATRELSDPDHDWRKGPGVPQAQPSELVPVCDRRADDTHGDTLRRGGYGMDFHDTAIDALPEHSRPHRGNLDLHRWVRIDLYRA